MVSHLVTMDLNLSSKLPSSVADAVVVAVADAVVVVLVACCLFRINYICC